MDDVDPWSYPITAGIGKRGNGKSTIHIDSQRLFPAFLTSIFRAAISRACHVWISGASFRKLEMEAAQQGILAAVHLQHPRRAGCLTYGKCQNVPF